jgi:hypothetical protein
MTLTELHALISLKINTSVPGEPDPPEALASPGDIAILRARGLVGEGSLVTAKGEAYIQALQAVPLPEQRWVIPEVYPHAIAQPAASAVHGNDGAQPSGSTPSKDPAASGERVQPSRRSKRNAKSSDESGR